MTPGEYNLRYVKGDRFAKVFQLRQRNPDGSLGDPIDFTGGAVQFWVKDTRTNPPAETEMTAAWTDETEGKLQISFTGAEGLALPDYNLRWRLRASPDGAEFETYLMGDLIPFWT